MTTTAEYAQFVEKTIPDEALLGSIIWFSISEADVELEQARKDLEALGLSTATLRKRLRPIDAFKKASNTLAKNNIRSANGLESNIMVRPVGQDTESSHRHVILERVQTGKGKRRKLAYDGLVEMVYNRGTRKGDEVTGDSIEITVREPAGLDLTDEERTWIEEKVPRIQAEFEHWCTHLDSHAVRTFVRDYINGLSGTLVKESGSVYFVRQSHADTIRALAQWVKSIGSDFHHLPLIDLVDQREMIVEAFEQETLKETQRLSAELSKILSNPTRTITEDTFNAYSTKAAELIAKTTEYEDMLGSKLDSTRIELDVFKKQTLQLISRIKKPKGRK